MDDDLHLVLGAASLPFELLSFQFEEIPEVTRDCYLILAFGVLTDCRGPGFGHTSNNVLYNISSNGVVGVQITPVS